MAGVLPVTRFEGVPIGTGHARAVDAAGASRPRGDDPRQAEEELGANADDEESAVTRDELIAATRQLIEEGERLRASPSLASLQMWLQRSDDLLSTAWGSMDRYHLAWLMVGKPKGIVRGRPMTPEEEAAYVREVAAQKTAALQMSLDAVERQQMPFVGETGGRGTGDQAAAGAAGSASSRPDRPADRGPGQRACRWTRRSPNGWPSARRRADEHLDHGVRRAPRPDRMQR